MVRTHAMASSIGWHLTVLGLIVGTAIWLAPPPPEKPEVEIDLRRTFTPPPRESADPVTREEPARSAERATRAPADGSEPGPNDLAPIESTSGSESTRGAQGAGDAPLDTILVTGTEGSAIREQPIVYRSGEGGVSWPQLIPGTDVQPEYPRPARIGRVEGMVELELTIGVDGAVERAEVVRESPAGFGFASAAQHAANQRRYRAAMRDGQPVAARLPVDIEFRLE